MRDKQRNYSLDESVQLDCNVFEEIQGIYSMDDRLLIHEHYIFRTKKSRKDQIKGLFVDALTSSIASNIFFPYPDRCLLS